MVIVNHNVISLRENKRERNPRSKSVVQVSSILEIFFYFFYFVAQRITFKFGRVLTVPVLLTAFVSSIVSIFGCCVYMKKCSDNSVVCVAFLYSVFCI